MNLHLSVITGLLHHEKRIQIKKGAEVHTLMLALPEEEARFNSWHLQIHKQVNVSFFSPFLFHRLNFFFSFTPEICSSCLLLQPTL